MENYITYGLIHFIAWPFVIILAYLWVQWAIKKYASILNKTD